MKKLILISLFGLMCFGCNNSKSDIEQAEVLSWQKGWDSIAIEKLVAEFSDSFCAEPFGDVSCSEMKEVSRCTVESFAYSFNYSFWDRFSKANVEEKDFTDTDWANFSKFIDLRRDCINSLNIDSDSFIIKSLEDDERRFNKMKSKYYQVDEAPQEDKDSDSSPGPSDWQNDN